MDSGTASLIFLDAIERRSASIAEAIKAQPNTLSQIVQESSKAILAALDSLSAVIKTMRGKDPESLRPLIEAVQAVQNSIVLSFNRMMADMGKQVASLVESNQSVLAELQRKKKFRLSFDRNSRTGLIQGDIKIEQID